MTPSILSPPERASKRGYQKPRRSHSKSDSPASAPSSSTKGRISGSASPPRSSMSPREPMCKKPRSSTAPFFSFTRGSESSSLPVGRYLSIMSLRSRKVVNRFNSFTYQIYLNFRACQEYFS